MNIYNIIQEDKPRWFGWGMTKGPLMIETHGIPRTGSDYNKARDAGVKYCLLYTSPSPRDQRGSRMPSSA